MVSLLGLLAVEPAAAQTRDLLTPVAPDAWALVTAGAVALTAGITLYLVPLRTRRDSDQQSWRRGVVFDESARDIFRLVSPGDRDVAAIASDLTMSGTLALGAADAIGVPLAQRDVDLSWQAGFAYALALGATMTVGELFKDTVGRARPFERDCAATPSGADCGTPNAFLGFYSLHASLAFAAAGFSCAMHLSRTLYGDELADGASCAASLTAATVTGLLRVMADRHYLSDSLVGALVGFVIGYLVPLFVLPDRRIVDPRSPLPLEATTHGTFLLSVGGTL